MIGTGDGAWSPLWAPLWEDKIEKELSEFCLLLPPLQGFGATGACPRPTCDSWHRCPPNKWVVQKLCVQEDYPPLPPPSLLPTLSG